MEVHVLFTQLPLVVTSYITAVQCQSQKVYISTILLTRLQTLLSFHCFFVYIHVWLYECVCIVLCYFIRVVICVITTEIKIQNCCHCKRTPRCLPHPCLLAATDLFSICTVCHFKNVLEIKSNTVKLFEIDLFC